MSIVKRTKTHLLPSEQLAGDSFRDEYDSRFCRSGTLPTRVPSYLRNIYPGFPTRYRWDVLRGDNALDSMYEQLKAAHPWRWAIFGALEKIFGHGSWVCRKARRWYLGRTD